MPGIYSLNTPDKLFEKLVRSFTIFTKTPCEDSLFDVLFPLCHLREWIYPNGYKSYKNKDQLSLEESLHCKLYSMNEYQIVLALCNNAKHYSVKKISNNTSQLEGKRYGLGRCGDSFNVTHFLVDETEIRDIFWPVYKIYFEYFRNSATVS